MPWHSALIALSTVLVSAIAAGAFSRAHAQTAVDDSVANRARPDFAARCIDLGADTASQTGGFRVCPTLAAETRFEDNVFRDADDERADVSLRVAPAVRVASDWAAHALSFSGAISATRYKTETSNDSTDYRLGANGRIDVSDDVRMDLGASWARSHRDRGDADSAGVGEEVDVFDRTSQSVGVRYAPSEFSFGVDVEVAQLDFKDTGAIDNDDEDRTEYDLSVRAAVALGSGISLFVTPRLEVRDFDLVVGGVDRDSQGYDVQVGASYDLSGVTFLQAGVGAFRRDFDNPDFAEETGASVSARAVWNATDLQTVTLSASRGLEETGEAGASSVVQTNVAVGVDFDLADNLVLNTRFSFQNEDFGDSGRDDDVYSAGIGTEFFINNVVRASASAQHQRRRSTLSAEDFDANTVGVGLRLQF